jgi:hypothetical protein
VKQISTWKVTGRLTATMEGSNIELGPAQNHRVKSLHDAISKQRPGLGRCSYTCFNIDFVARYQDHGHGDEEVCMAKAK